MLWGLRSSKDLLSYWCIGGVYLYPHKRRCLQRTYCLLDPLCAWYFRNKKRGGSRSIVTTWMKYITTSRKRLLVILIFGTYYLSLYATRDISSSSLRRSTSLYMSSQAVWYYLSTNKPMPMPPKQCKCKSLWKSLKVPQYQRTVQYATWEMQMQIIKTTRESTNQCRCHHSALGAWSNIVPLKRAQIQIQCKCLWWCAI